MNAEKSGIDNVFQDEAFDRMFAGKSEQELETLTQRENMAVLIGRELAAFLLKEHVALDAAVQPAESCSACCLSQAA